MQDEGFQLTPFTAYEPQRQARPVYRGGPGRVWSGRKPKGKARAGSMLAKICLCMLILAGAVLIQALALRPAEEAAVAASAESDASGGVETDDVLGRLRFVESGGVKSVFSVSQRWSLPVQSVSAALLADETLLRLTASPGGAVSLAAAGEVRAIGKDDSLGTYIRVFHGSDLESCYYNVEGIRVEEGQPLAAGDTLGKVAADGLLFVTVTKTGEKQNPGLYLDVEDE